MKKLQNNLSEKCCKVYEKFCSFADMFDKNRKLNIAVICFVCVALFALALFMNSMTHLALDDYAYHFIFLEEGEGDGGYFNTGDRVENVSDIITSMKAHYKTVNGRIFLHFFVQLMLLIGKPIFNVINSVMLVLFVVLIYLHCKGADKRQSALMFLMCTLAVWTFNPTPSFTIFWLDGSINYLWGSVIRLAALLPFRRYYDTGEHSHQGLALLPITVMCLFAGATNENTSAGFVGMVFLYIITYRLKGIKIPAWSVTGFAASVAGYLFMVLAPATGVRIDKENQSGLLKAIAILVSSMFVKLLPYLTVALLIILILYTLKKKEKINISLFVIYTLGALAAEYVMIFPQIFPERAWFGIIILAIIAVGTLLYQLISLDHILLRRCMFLCLLCWMLWGAVTFGRAAYDAILVDKEFDAREAYIEQQKELGNLDLTVRGIYSNDERAPHYGVLDVNKDPEHRRNVDVAKYYGLNSIVLGSNNDY